MDLDMKQETYGPGKTLDPDGPTRDVRVCFTPEDEDRCAKLARQLGVTRSEVVRRGMALLEKQTQRKKR